MKVSTTPTSLSRASVLLVFWAVFLPLGCQQSEYPSARPEPLERFDGYLDQSNNTFDTVKSEIYMRASQSLAAGDTETAKAVYREAIAKYPNDSEGFEALAACFYFEERYDAAKAEYERAIRVNPVSARAYYGLGCIAYEERQNDEAIVLLKQALTHREQFGICHRMLAIVYDETNDIQKALVHYERALALGLSSKESADIRRRLEEIKD